MKDKYNTYLGGFDYEHKNPPAPFNPDADPAAKQWYADVTASLEADGFYETHTRQECAAEWRRRYDVLEGKV